MADIWLLLGLVTTVGHAVIDVVLAFCHLRHPVALKALTFISVGFLIAHVITAGEAAQWMGLLW